MGWVSQATEKVSEAATQALQPIEKGLSQGITDLGRTIADSPALETAITAIATYAGVPPAATASFLAANKTSQTGGNLEKGLETLLLSYGGAQFVPVEGINLATPEGIAAAQSTAQTAAATGGGEAVSTLVGGGGTGIESILTAGSAPGALAATEAAYLAAPSAEVLAGAGLLGGLAAGSAPAATGAPAILTAGSAPGALAALSGSLAAPSAEVLANAAAAAGGGLLSTYGPSLVTGGLDLLGASNTAEKAREAAQTQAAAQVEAARIAAEAAKFRPVGVTTRFGTSQFTTDAQGNVIGAGYAASPEIKAYQDRLSALAAQGLTGAEGAAAAYAPLTTGAQSLFKLGQGYIQETPEQQAAAYIAKQQALLDPMQQQQLAQLQTKLQAQGRGGLSVAQGGDLMATSPELAAYYNALTQSNLQLAAQGQLAGMEQARFGAGLLGTGSDLMGKYYGGLTASYAPFATAIDTSSGLENLAQQPMTLGTQIGAKTTASAAEAGRLLGQGMLNSATTQAPANAFSYSGNLFSQAANNPQLQAAILKAFST
jgi:hypothetical protein